MKRLTDEQRAERTAQYLAQQQSNHAVAMERRRARYAHEIAHLESCVDMYTVSDADYRKYFRFVPRFHIDEKLRQVQERLDWVRKYCELTDA